MNLIITITLLIFAFQIVNTLPSKQQPSFPFSISLTPWLNNKAFGADGDFDHVGTTFTTNKQTSKFVANHTSAKYDNIEIDHTGKLIPLDTQVPLGALYVLVSASHGPLTIDASVIYNDKTQDTTTLSLPDWQDDHLHEMQRYRVLQYPLSNNRQGALFHAPIYTDPEKLPTHLQFSNGDNQDASLHLFSVVAYPVKQDVIVSDILVTHEWRNKNDQVLVVKLHNTGTSWAHDLDVHVISDQVKTVEHGYASLIAPGHVHHVQVVVSGQEQQTNVTVSVGNSKSQHRIKLEASPEYEATSASVKRHRPPTWLKQSKFGIFIHWGLYSVPAWAPVGESYAEWYWWNMHNEPTYSYHRDTYGTNFTYDDFLSLWKPTQFSPQMWLDLVDRSRAKYFVFTTKHHDGIALFNTSVTDRSTSRLLFPNRDFVEELMGVAESQFPHLKRGLYFSLPEWYHPKYNDDSLGWHGPPINPYTQQRVAYRGSKTIDDFVNELQVPQFQELVHQYNPDILWCDIGGINNSTVWQADYFNKALDNGRQVAVNDRCGDGSASDFTTIEYKAVKDTPSRFWEATRGMDPYSFGFNKYTKPEEYASSRELMENLVDSMSRGGNFLLNIGPEATGNVPEPMVQRLLEIGEWLDLVGTSVFDSVPYWITPEEDDFRFTMGQDGSSVYVFLFGNVEKTLEIKTPVPVRKSTNIRLLNRSEASVPWKVNQQGNLVLDFNSLMKDAQQMLIPVIQIKL